MANATNMQKFEQEMLAKMQGNIMSIFFMPIPTNDRVKSKLKMSYNEFETSIRIKSNIQLWLIKPPPK